MWQLEQGKDSKYNLTNTKTCKNRKKKHAETKHYFII